MVNFANFFVVALNCCIQLSFWLPRRAIFLNLICLAVLYAYADFLITWTELDLFMLNYIFEFVFRVLFAIKILVLVPMKFFRKCIW